jgi:hypothetical protein
MKILFSGEILMRFGKRAIAYENSIFTGGKHDEGIEDAEVDVLYIHFEEKPSSTHSEMRDDGIILDYRDNLLVRLTVLEASQR